jgi:SWI/SNF-related matrix-associated actin-dependent regulator of chromatin subfamily A3
MFRRFIATPFTESEQRRAVAIKNLTKLLDAVSLRRTKDLLHLPKREERVHTIEFTAEERFQYDQTFQRMNRRMREHDSVEDAGSRFGLFHIQLQLRILCNHGTFQDPFSWAHVDPRDIQETAMNMMQHSSEVRCSVCRQAMPTLAATQFDEACGSRCSHALCPDCLDEIGTTDKALSGYTSNCPLCATRVVKKARSERASDERSEGQLSTYFMAPGYSSKMVALVNDVQKDLWNTKR